MLAGIDYLRTLSRVDTKRLAVMGWSFGGVVTLNMGGEQLYAKRPHRRRRKLRALHAIPARQRRARACPVFVAGRQPVGKRRH